MKLIKVLAVCGLFVAGTALAEKPDRPERPARPGGDGDRGKEHFASFDTDGNGELSVGEFTVMHKKHTERMKERLGDKFDAEKVRPAAEVFGRIDADGSGGATPAELQKFRSARDHGGKEGKGEKGGDRDAKKGGDRDGKKGGKKGGDKRPE